MVEESALTESGENEPRRKQKKQRPLWQEIPILLLIAAVLTFLLQTFIARVYLIPSQSMEPTLNGCTGCTGDRVVVQKISYDFGDPEPGDVVVFLGPPAWNENYKSIRSGNPVLRGMQNVGSVFGLVPPDENDLVKRVIATGGQKVKCCDTEGRVQVDGKSLTEPYVQTPPVMNDERVGVVGDFPFTPGEDCTAELAAARLRNETRVGRCFAEVTVPEGTLWVMGDNRSNSEDSRFHGPVPIDNVRGKAVFKIWPLNRFGTISSPDPHSN